MKISIIKGMKIPLLTRVTKLRTECCAEKNIRQVLFSRRLFFLKVLSGFKTFAGGEGGGGHERSVKHYFFQEIFHIN